MAEGRKVSSQTGKTALFAYWVGAMLSPKGKGDRQVASRVPLVLPVESESIEGNPLRGMRSETLHKFRVIGVRRGWVHATLVESIESLGREYSYKVCVDQGGPIDPLEVCPEPELLPVWLVVPPGWSASERVEPSRRGQSMHPCSRRFPLDARPSISPSHT